MSDENAQPEPAPFVFAKGTDVGRVRDHNEDFLDAFSPPDPVQRHQKGVLFVVADGMGGHQAGDVASQSAVEMISQQYYADPDVDVRRSLTLAIKRANEYIYQEAQRMATRAGMGTTVVAAVVRGRELYLANVGDSRAYMMRQGKVTQATRDHSFVAEQVRAGLLTAEEARAHPQRNVITRALGSRPDVKVDTYSGELLPGDALLLCTDGLSEYVREEDMLAAMSQYPPSEAVPRLIAMASDRGGSDNISALVVQAALPGGEASTMPLMPAAKVTPATPRRRLLPWMIAGLGGIALAGIALIVVGGFFLPGLFSRETPAPSETPILTDALDATPLPTATLAPTETETAAAGSVGFTLESPLDGARVPSGTIDLRWRWSGPAPDQLVDFVVNSDHGELCELESDTDPCAVVAEEGDDYEWWVELRAGGLVTRASEHWSFTVGPPSAETPAVTVTPAITGTASSSVLSLEDGGDTTRLEAAGCL